MMGNRERRGVNFKGLLRRNWLLIATVISVLLGMWKPPSCPFMYAERMRRFLHWCHFPPLLFIAVRMSIPPSVFYHSLCCHSGDKSASLTPAAHCLSTEQQWRLRCVLRSSTHALGTIIIFHWKDGGRVTECGVIGGRASVLSLCLDVSHSNVTRLRGQLMWGVPALRQQLHTLSAGASHKWSRKGSTF